MALYVLRGSTCRTQNQRQIVPHVCHRATARLPPGHRTFATGPPQVRRAGEVRSRGERGTRMQTACDYQSSAVKQDGRCITVRTKYESTLRTQYDYVYMTRIGTGQMSISYGHLFHT